MGYIKHVQELRGNSWSSDRLVHEFTKTEEVIIKRDQESFVVFPTEEGSLLNHFMGTWPFDIAQEIGEILNRMIPEHAVNTVRMLQVEVDYKIFDEGYVSPATVVERNAVHLYLGDGKFLSARFGGSRAS